ncbi:MAG: ABC transporter substrate-binding protein [Limisphaerales bacterium]|jgi:NitT/TauT family transport system substrate-binding protein
MKTLHGSAQNVRFFRDALTGVGLAQSVTPAMRILFLSICLLWVGCSPKESGSPSASTTSSEPVLNFIHDWIPEPEHGGYYAADRLGLWKAEGVAVRVLVGGPNSEIEKRVALDPFGLGIVRGDAVFVAVERGLPVVAVNAYFQHDPQGIMVRDDSPVRTFADLENRDIAMQIGATWLLYLQKKYALSKVRVRPVTGNVANFVKDPDWITQAYPTSEPYYALKEGVKSRVLQISESGFDPYRVIIANRQLVEKHPELVARFSRGAYRGWQEYYRSPQPIHDYLRSISPTMEDGGMRFSYVAMRRLRLSEGDPSRTETMGAVDLERWRSLGVILKDLGVIQSVPPLEAVVSTAFTPKALGLDPTLPPPFWTDAPTPSPKP